MNDTYIAMVVVVIAIFVAASWIVDAIRDNKVDNAVLHNTYEILQTLSKEMSSMSWRQERHEDFIESTTNENSDRLEKQIEILKDMSQEIVGQGRSGLDGNLSSLRHSVESQEDSIEKLLGLVGEISFR